MFCKGKGFCLQIPVAFSLCQISHKQVENMHLFIFQSNFKGWKLLTTYTFPFLFSTHLNNDYKVYQWHLKFSLTFNLSFSFFSNWIIEKLQIGSQRFRIPTLPLSLLWRVFNFCLWVVLFDWIASAVYPY